nr:hypothetical protein CPGR_00014 [Mycolicibacter nonchromogenicus]
MQKCWPRPNARDRLIGRSHWKASGSGYSRSSRLAEANRVMMRWPGLTVVPCRVNGLRAVRANHCAGAQ